MLKTRMRKILRDVIARKGRTFLVSLAIFIGVAGTITLFSMSDIIVKQLQADIQEDKLAMLLAFATIESGGELNNEADVAAIRDYPGVTQLVAGNQSAVYFKKEADEEEFEEAFITGFSDPLESLSLEPMRLVDGSWPAPDSKQFVIEMRMAEEFDLKVGDTVIVRALGALSEGGDPASAEENWTISGTVFHPYAQSPKEAAYGLLSDVEYISGVLGFNAFWVRFTDFETADESSVAFNQSVSDDTPYRINFSQEQDPAKNQLIESAKLIGNILGTMALASLVVSGFLVVNVITSIVTEQKRLIGVMKSLGATRLDNFVMYCGLALVYGLIGVIPGVILGIIGGQVTSSLLGPELNTVLEGFHWSPGSVLIGVMIGLAVPVIASLIPVFNGTRVTILDAMTDLGISGSSGTRTRLTATSAILYLVLGLIFSPLLVIYGIIWALMAAILWVMRRLPLPLNFRHGINSVNVKKRRLVLTVFTLALAVGAFMGIFAVFASLTNAIDSFLDTYNVDVFVFSNSTKGPEVVTTAITGIPELNPPEAGYQLQMDFEGYDYKPIGFSPPVIIAYGYDINSDNPAFKYDLASGEGLTNDNYQDGIVFSEALADVMDKGLGDKVVALSVGERKEFTIVGIGDFPVEQVWLDWRTMALLSGSVDAEGNPLPQGYFVTLKEEEPTAREVDKLIDKMSEAFAAQGINAQFFNFVELTESFASGLQIFQIIFSGVALLIGVVGALGLLTALSISVFERQKEIGVMRSIGAGSGTVATQFLTEGLLVGFMAWLVGIPLSIGFAGLLVQAAEFGDGFQLYSIPAMIIGLVGVMVVTTLASVGPSLGAARKTVSDILRYQ